MHVVMKTRCWLAIAALAFAMSACKASAPAAPETVSKPKPPTPPVVAETPAEPAAQAPAELSKLSAGMAYGDMRKLLLANGWLPLRDPKCWENVGGEASVCNLLPETENCSADGYCRTQFAKAPNIALAVVAYGSYTAWDKSGPDSTCQIKSLDWSRIEKPTVTCPSQDFDEFLSKFASDGNVQRAYTAPLVKVAEIEDRSDNGYFPRMVYETAADYRGFNVVYADNAFHFLDGQNKRDPSRLTLSTDAPTADRRDVSYAYGMSEGNSYRFDKKDGCWVLTEDPKPPTP